MKIYQQNNVFVIRESECWKIRLTDGNLEKDTWGDFLAASFGNTGDNYLQMK